MFIRASAGVLSAALCAAVACGPAAPPANDPGTEEVPVAFGTQEREQITGAVSSVPMDEAVGRRYASIEEMLAGKVAGVQVTRTASGISVRIRGSGSLRSNNEPLYVVDGVTVITGRAGAGISVSPHDVARIEILKDASAAALYGSRGANGVVVITTKRGL